jgi:hypothetical protein
MSGTCYIFNCNYLILSSASAFLLVRCKCRDQADGCLLKQLTVCQKCSLVA